VKLNPVSTTAKLIVQRHAGQTKVYLKPTLLSLTFSNKLLESGGLSVDTRGVDERVVGRFLDALADLAEEVSST
jgi:hypothetical protein